jgi:hypothetical protein
VAGIGGHGAEVAEAHRKLLADGSIQFDLPPPVPVQVPSWMLSLGHFIRWAAPALSWLFWAVIGLGLLAIVWLVAIRISQGEWRWRRRRKTGDEAEPDWRPVEAPARALLRDADALAEQGRFDEAAHLLLFRSIDEIESRRPRLVRPALTSRDIAGAEMIPAGARRAFAAIVSMVERSLFAGRALVLADWRECRAAYEDFAFAGAWR